MSTLTETMLTLPNTTISDVIGNLGEFGHGDEVSSQHGGSKSSITSSDGSEGLFIDLSAESEQSSDEDVKVDLNVRSSTPNFSSPLQLVFKPHAELEDEFIDGEETSRDVDGKSIEVTSHESECEEEEESENANAGLDSSFEFEWEEKSEDASSEGLESGDDKDLASIEAPETFNLIPFVNLDPLENPPEVFWGKNDFNDALKSFGIKYNQVMEGLKMYLKTGVDGVPMTADLKEIQEDFMTKQVENRKKMYMDYLGTQSDAEDSSMDLMEFMVRKNHAQNPDPNIRLYKKENHKKSSPRSHDNLNKLEKEKKDPLGELDAILKEFTLDRTDNFM